MKNWKKSAKNVRMKNIFTLVPIVARHIRVTQIGEYYHVHVDRFPTEDHIGLVRSKDLVHWEDHTSHIKFREYAKHGTVFKVTPELVKLISNAGL